MPKSQARLTVYTLEGRRIQVVSMTAASFHAGTHPLLADADYRKKKRVRWILGYVFDARGAIELDLAYGYDARGKYIGQRLLKASQVKLDTLAQVRATLRQRPRRHEGIPVPQRKRIVALVAKELMRGRRLADIAKYLSIPNPTLTRWTKGLPRKNPPLKKNQLLTPKR